MPPGFCSACYAGLRWVKTTRGAAMPLDPEPCDDGNVIVTPGGALVLNSELREKAKRMNLALYKPHFATCPFAARFKKERA
jgi:hypothetical protein